MIHVRLATSSDSEDIFEWRNDNQTRQMSHNSELVQWAEHSRWFEKTLVNEDRRLLVCVEETNIRVGVVRFDVGVKSAEISINIAPNKRGMGIAKACLTKAIEDFQRCFPKHKTLIAEIKSKNLSSQTLFEGVGFTFIKEADEVRHYSLPL